MALGCRAHTSTEPKGMVGWIIQQRCYTISRSLVAVGDCVISFRIRKETLPTYPGKSVNLFALASV
jgi:hypothetical protein